MQLLDCRGATALDDKICGSNRIFFAPEIQDAATKVTPLVDVWSLGAILYVLIANSVVGDSKRITNQDSDVFDFQQPEWNNCSEHVTEFIKGCLQVDVKKRLTVD